MKMWKGLSPVKKEIFLLLIMAVFGLVKQLLVYNLPIMAVPKGVHDDWIMVHLADTLRSGSMCFPADPDEKLLSAEQLHINQICIS